MKAPWWEIEPETPNGGKGFPVGQTGVNHAHFRSMHGTSIVQQGDKVSGSTQLNEDPELENLGSPHGQAFQFFLEFSGRNSLQKNEM